MRRSSQLGIYYYTGNWIPQRESSTLSPPNLKCPPHDLHDLDDRFCVLLRRLAPGVSRLLNQPDIRIGKQDEGFIADLVRAGNERLEGERRVSLSGSEEMD